MSRHAIESRTQQHADVHQLQHDRAQGRDVFIDTLAAAELVGYRVNRSDPDSVRRAQNAFRMFARRSGIEFAHRGRRLVVSRLDVEAELRRKAVA